LQAGQVGVMKSMNTGSSPNGPETGSFPPGHKYTAPAATRISTRIPSNIRFLSIGLKHSLSFGYPEGVNSETSKVSAGTLLQNRVFLLSDHQMLFASVIRRRKSTATISRTSNQTDFKII